MSPDPPRRLVFHTAPSYDQPKFQMMNQIYFWLAILSEQNFILILYSESDTKIFMYLTALGKTSLNIQPKMISDAIQGSGVVCEKKSFPLITGENFLLG